VTATDGDRASGDGTVYVEKLWRLFDRVMIYSVDDRALASAAARNLTSTQFDGLRFLARHPDCTIGDIAQGLVVSYPAATRLVSRLENRGLVTRAHAETDQRVVQVALTDSGTQAERSTRARRAALLNRILEALPDSRRRTLVTSLERLLVAALNDRRLIEAICLRCGADHDPDCLVNRAYINLTGESIAAV